jgi:ribosomal protein L11 methyltransferase
MDYNKITINITPFQEWLRDVLTAQLGEIGFNSFVETEAGFEAFIPVKDFSNENMNLVLTAFKDDFTFSVISEIIPDQNWNEVWEKNYFKPLVISNECVIRAPFHTDYPQAKYEIIIEPNMAFGTGNHETTSLVIETILDETFTGKSVLDMGCGTGILGILASMKGAKEITAIDIDEWSFKGTKENAALNNIQNINVRLGDASLLGNEKFDVIFANIHKNVLLNDMQAYFNVLLQNGILIMSGFYSEDIREIKLKAEKLGLKDIGFKTKNNWVAYSFQKEE